MGTLTRFEDLEAWNTGRELANFVYNLTDVGASARDFCLRDQIRRAAVSGMSNIAEGFDSQSNRNFIRFLAIARASQSEVKSQLYLAYDRRYIDRNDFDAAYDLCDKSARQISRLIGYLRSIEPRR